MKTSLAVVTLASALTVSGAALGADFSRGPSSYYRAAPVSLYDWSGPYAGLNVGYEWGDVSGSPTQPSGVFGGGQLGYNWQNGAFVFGGETDLQASSADDTFAPYKFSNPWFGTTRGRLGYALNNILFYGTLGVAYGDLTAENAVGFSETKTHFGWSGGLGMEIGFTPDWSARIEYLYMDLGSRTYSITGVGNGLESNMLRFGVNYHF